MANKKYLKPNVVAEPLINQWYAWPHLIPPHTYAMFLENLQLKIMASYVRAPKLHANAVKNPKMNGAPFMDLPGDQSGAVRALMARTRENCADLLVLAQAIRDLNEVLEKEADGHSLLDLYPKIPPALRGLVELGYDLHHQPSVRFIERLIFAGPYYRTDYQSVSLFSVHQDHRPFVLSTPRFPGPDRIHYDLPFHSDALDRLFSMRDTPQTQDFIADLIPEDPAQRALFDAMFTDEEPVKRGRDRAELGDRVRIKYFGHAVVMVETAEVSIITDPLISYDFPGQEVARFTFMDLPEKIDYVLLTHAHQDHVMFETLLQLRHKIGTIVVPKSNGGSLQDPSLRLILEQVGFQNVVEMEELETLAVPHGTITGLPFLGEHGDLHIRSKLGFHIRLKDRTVVCAADSNNLSPELYDHVKTLLGPVDHMFLGMECQGAPLSWLYGPLITCPIERGMDQSRRFDGSDCAKGLEMVKSLESKAVYVYAMGQEPWLNFISSIQYSPDSKPIVESENLVRACLDAGLHSERLYGKKELYV